MPTIVRFGRNLYKLRLFCGFMGFMDYITGSNGFLGSHLYKALCAEKRHVFPIPHEAIDVTTLKPFDHFYFLSSYGNMWGQDDIEKTIKANILDVIHILKEASRFQFKSFIFMSTSSVKLDIQTPYSRAKKAAEEILLSYAEKFNLPICIIRPLSITGVGEQKEHLIPKLIHSCYTGELVNFVPRATHDYIDVSDVVSAITNLSNRSLRGIFELGWGDRVTNEKVLGLVEKITGRKANINVVDSLRPYDNFQWFATNYKARSWGWLPKKKLEDSIKEMVEAYDK